MADSNTSFIGNLKSFFTFTFPHLFAESTPEKYRNSSGKRRRLQSAPDDTAAPPKRTRIDRISSTLAQLPMTSESTSSEQPSSSSSRETSTSSASVPSSRSPSSSDSDTVQRVIIIPRRLSAGDGYPGVPERRAGSLPPLSAQSLLLTRQRDGSYPPSLKLLQSRPTFIREPLSKPKPSSLSPTPLPDSTHIAPYRPRKCLISGCDCKEKDLLHELDLYKTPLIPGAARSEASKLDGQFTFTNAFSRPRRALTLMADDGSDVVSGNEKEEKGEDSAGEGITKVAGSTSVPVTVAEGKKRPKKRKSAGEVKEVSESSAASSAEEEEKKRSTKRRKLEKSLPSRRSPRKPSSTFSAAYEYDEAQFKGTPTNHDTQKGSRRKLKAPESSIQKQLRLLRVQLP
ncbi:hypothetical protein Moror_16456 [Moniliophthora roreri MCA 2997]|uniref:Uncharacterized protein n=2 Tax=Moniliophthora roreri TaxID=221103 RepID=V2XED4_MONRO|nr:hypothetical protein Moror_16456 [Moniliophthora roreri MCA 2997]